MAAPPPSLGTVRAAMATLGAAFIYLLIRAFGRRVTQEEVPWLWGPFGGDYIGDKPYEECARREGLTLERNVAQGGLLQDFAALSGDGFSSADVHPLIRDFYERTAEYRMDVWAQSSFPASIGLWLLVTTLSRKVSQLDFPLRALDTARGIDSEIALLRETSGRVRYAGWHRRLSGTGRVVYTGFYMSERVPRARAPCVKVVFPMPQGNATVLLRPSVDERGALNLTSEGDGFGDAGFYRVQRGRDGVTRAWRITTLKERFRVYVDDAQTLRCDHAVRFWSMPVLTLHYRIERRR